MRNLLLAIIIMMTFTMTTTAQNYKLVDGQLVEQPKEDTTKKGSTKTKMTITKKGVVYPVWKGSKGGLYIIRTSKKGNKYRQYLKIVK